MIWFKETSADDKKRQDEEWRRQKYGREGTDMVWTRDTHETDRIPATT